MGQADTTAVATAQPPCIPQDVTPSTVPRITPPLTGPAPAPRRGVRISRTRAEPRAGAALDAVVLEYVMGWEWRPVEPAAAPEGGPKGATPDSAPDAAPNAPPTTSAGTAPLRLLWNPRWGKPHCAGDVRPVDDLTPRDAGAGPCAIPWDAPRPSTDPAAACEMEAEIERRGLQYPYTVALTEIVAHTKSSQQGWENGWRLMRATPAQRCRAALRAAGYGPRC